MCGYSSDALDALLADQDTLANVDATIGILRALGLEPRSVVIRQQAALNEVEPDRAELLVALIGRRLNSLEAPL